MTKKYVVLDTDIGDDIDDALALLLLLRMEGVELLGVTTVFANTPLRARLAKRILHLAGRTDIPVYTPPIPVPPSIRTKLIKVYESFYKYNSGNVLVLC